jgi:hypothetical protein
LRYFRAGWLLSFLFLGCGDPSAPEFSGGSEVLVAPVEQSGADAPVTPVSWAAPSLEVATPLFDCGYSETDYRIAWCNGRYRNIWELSPRKTVSGCAAHVYRVGTHFYPTQADALGAEQCEQACVYRLSAAVMFLRCGHRDEFMEYAAAAPECPALYGFSDGTLGNDVDVWVKNAPCP